MTCSPHRGALAAAALLIALTGCAAPVAADGQVDGTYSSTCSVGLILEPDSTPGAETRLGELERRLADWERMAAEAPAVDSVRDDDPHAVPSTSDPIKIQGVIRGIKSLIEALPEAERDKSSDDVVSVEVVTDSGLVLASAEISPHLGGYRVTQLISSGLTSDHPSCVA